MASPFKRFLIHLFDSQPHLNRRAMVFKRNFDEVNRMVQSFGKPTKKRKTGH